MMEADSGREGRVERGHIRELKKGFVVLKEKRFYIKQRWRVSLFSCLAGSYFL